MPVIASRDLRNHTADVLRQVADGTPVTIFIRSRWVGGDRRGLSSPKVNRLGLVGHSEVVGNGLCEGGAHRLADAQDGGDRLTDQVGIGQRRQIDVPDPIGILIVDVFGDMDRQAGLAHSAGPCQGH